MALHVRYSNVLNRPRFGDQKTQKHSKPSKRHEKPISPAWMIRESCSLIRAIDENNLHGIHLNVDTEETNHIIPNPSTKRRVLLKISGEALQGPKGYGIDSMVLRSVAIQIAECSNQGYQIAIVVGGGNFFRGVNAFEGIDRATADYVGMLATVMNAVCLQSILEDYGLETRLQTALEIREIAEPYIRRKAIRHLELGRVVIFGAGTGNPFFTTDTAAVLRAVEIDAHEVLKATKVQGVYTSDPEKDPRAQFLDHLTYDRALRDGLKVMDETAFILSKEHRLPVRIFNIFGQGNITKAIRGESVGSIMQLNEEAVKSRTDPKSRFIENDHSNQSLQFIEIDSSSQDFPFNDNHAKLID